MLSSIYECFGFSTQNIFALILQLDIYNGYLYKKCYLFKNFTSFVCVHERDVCTFVCVCVCVYIQGPQVNIGCRFQSMSTLSFETRSLTEPRVHWFSHVGCQQALGPHLSLATCKWNCDTMSGLSHACWISELKSLCEPSPQHPQNFTSIGTRSYTKINVALQYEKLFSPIAYINTKGIHLLIIN